MALEIRKSDIVMAAAGRDKGGLFFVLETDGVYAQIANGRQRRLEKPKTKKLRHLRYVAPGDCRAGEKLRSGEKVTNNDLRRALASFNAEVGEQEVCKLG
jgi:hypothetical protein